METYRVISIKVRAVPGVTNVTVDLVWDPPLSPDMMSEAARLQLDVYRLDQWLTLRPPWLSDLPHVPASSHPSPFCCSLFSAADRSWIPSANGGSLAPSGTQQDG